LPICAAAGIAGLGARQRDHPNTVSATFPLDRLREAMDLLWSRTSNGKTSLEMRPPEK